MTTPARVQNLANRAFLTIPLGLIIVSAALFPMAAHFWPSLRNAALFFYAFSFVFLKTTSFGEGIAQGKVKFSLSSWGLGLGLSIASLTIAGVVYALFDVPLLLRALMA